MPDVWEELERAGERLRSQWRIYSARHGKLTCVECGRTDDRSELGWRTYLTVDDELATYCPECAEAEFDA